MLFCVVSVLWSGWLRVLLCKPLTSRHSALSQAQSWPSSQVCPVTQCLFMPISLQCWIGNISQSIKVKLYTKKGQPMRLISHWRGRTFHNEHPVNNTPFKHNAKTFTLPFLTFVYSEWNCLTVVGEDAGQSRKMRSTNMSVSTINGKKGAPICHKTDHRNGRKVTTGHQFTERLEISVVSLVVSGC